MQHGLVTHTEAQISILNLEASKLSICDVLNFELPRNIFAGKFKSSVTTALCHKLRSGENKNQ